MTEDKKKPEPNWQDDIPYCGFEGAMRCQCYDGKRCELIGGRPQAICEPAVAEMARKLAAAEKEPEAPERPIEYFDKLLDQSLSVSFVLLSASDLALQAIAGYLSHLVRR